MVRGATERIIHRGGARGEGGGLRYQLFKDDADFRAEVPLDRLMNDSGLSRCGSFSLHAFWT